jgi:hypothetical protein
VSRAAAIERQLAHDRAYEHRHVERVVNAAPDAEDDKDQARRDDRVQRQPDEREVPVDWLESLLSTLEEGLRSKAISMVNQMARATRADDRQSA